MAKKNFKNAAEAFISAAANDPSQEKKDDEIRAEIRAALRAGDVPEGYMLRPVAKSSRLQLLVTPDTKRRLSEAAAAQGISVNELANRAFTRYLATNDHTENETQ